MTTRRPPKEKHSRSAVELPSVTLIGYGNWGAALAFALCKANVPLREIIVRGPAASDRRRAPLPAEIDARQTTLDDAWLDADVFWICTPDAAIAEAGEQLAAALAKRQQRSRPVVFHSSGALGSAELERLQAIGASGASVHPLMTFPGQRSSGSTGQTVLLEHVPFAVEGDARACRVARRLVRALGGDAFALSAENKALYHAFGAFASPLLIALLTATRDAGAAAGLSPTQARKRMRPIVERTVQNFFDDGPEKSFSGPMARGDAATISRHLDVLRKYPQLLATYRELAQFALESLPAKNKTQTGEALRRASISQAFERIEKRRNRTSSAR